MENHVYKHHFRHGHHHHKHNTFYALLAMIFFGAITLGVVASIYYSMIPVKNQSATGGENSRCLPGYPECNDTPNQPNPAAGACLEGTGECNDTPEMYESGQSSSDAIISASENEFRYNNSLGYSVTIPSQMGVYGNSEDYIWITYPEGKQIFTIKVEENFDNQNLNQAFDSVYNNFKPNTYSEHTLDDMKTSNVKLGGVSAKKLDISNYPDVGGTLIVAVYKGKIYTIQGSSKSVSDWVNEKSDVIKFAETFEFIN